VLRRTTSVSEMSVQQRVFVELVVRCESWQHAQRITDHLLVSGLIDSAHMLATKSSSIILFVKCEMRNQLLINIELVSQFNVESDTICRLPLEYGSERSRVDINANALLILEV
jgi:hypothetical protein